MIPARLQVLILGLEPMRRLEVWVFRVSLASHSFPSFPSFTPSGSCEAFATNEHHSVFKIICITYLGASR